MKKNILIVAHSLGGGGVEKVVLNLTQGFKYYACNVIIALLSNTMDYEIDNGYDIIILKKSKLFKKISFAFQIKKIIQENNIDLVISNFTDFSGMKIIDLVNFENTITIVHNTQSKRRFKRHRQDSLLKSYKKYKVEKSFENKNLSCVSDGVREDLIQNFSIKSKKLVTIYNPFDFDTILKMSQIKNDNIPQEDYIIHVGRFELRHKRQDLLLKAYKESNISYKLILLGDGSDKQKIIDLIDELDLNEKVVLAGFDANSYNWIRNARLLVFSSDYEGFGMVLVEALILNTPVVSTNCASGPSEILIDELADYLSEVGNIKELARNIKKALVEYPQITDKYYSKFDTKYIAKQYLEFFND